ncbi:MULTISPECIES: SAM-dependent methyltransferase [Rhodomicrobium]|uniref:SAM-dependent methyltransferase n=1 Tax=Rhodomicrobium TaxID=1068 RepID=UPI000B4ACFB6|nr:MULTISPECIES: SAM-dependent methyltransferase [Rhodomicrobium]
MALATGGKRHAHKVRGADLYETPPEAVRALLEHVALPRCIWEPACGPGAIVRVLRASGFTVFASDLNDWACPDSLARVDFLMERRAPVHIQAIVTNPPYMVANAFIYNALELVPRVYMLLPLQYMEGGEKDWRRDSLIDGGHLARVLPFRERLPMMHRHGWVGKHASSSRCYAWFVWDRAHRGPAVIERISLKKGSERPALNEKAA